jgi:hypothetical protein
MNCRSVRGRQADLEVDRRTHVAEHAAFPARRPGRHYGGGEQVRIVNTEIRYRAARHWYAFRLATERV